MNSINLTNFADVCPYLIYNNELENCDYDDIEVANVSRTTGKKLKTIKILSQKILL